MGFKGVLIIQTCFPDVRAVLVPQDNFDYRFVYHYTEFRKDFCLGENPTSAIVIEDTFVNI